MEDRIDKLQQDAIYATRRAQEISSAAEKEERTLTAEEERQITNYLEESETLEAKIAEIRRTLDTQAKIEERVKAQQQPNERRGAPAQTPAGIAAEERNQRGHVDIEIPLSCGTLKAFKNDADGRRDAYFAGMWAQAIINDNPEAKRFLDRNAPHIGNRAMSGLLNSKGGVLVPDTIANAIITLRDEYGVFPGLAQNVAMPSDVYKAPKSLNAATAVWDGEGGTAGATDPEFNLVELIARKLKAYVIMPNELAEDSVVSVGDFVVNEIAWAMSQKFDAAAINGDGTSTYGGIRGLVHIFENDGLAGAVDAASGVDTPGEITNADLTSLMGELRDYAYKRGNPVWLCSRTYAHVVFDRLKAVAGGNTTQTLAGGTGMSYLGYPIVTSEEMPKALTGMNNKVMLAFGNFELSTMVGNRRGIRIEESREHKFIEDQTTILATQRIDLNHHDVGSTTEAGSVVALVGNT